LACHSEESRSDRDDEESRIALKTLRARFLAEFTLSGQSEILRCAQDDSEGLGMTAWKGFPAARSTTTWPLSAYRSGAGVPLSKSMSIDPWGGGLRR
jgi:hypothetical protein